MTTLVAGAGLAGLSCARALKGGYRLFERGDRPGGLCRTERRNGYTIDLTGHYLHFRDTSVFRMVQGLLGPNLASRPRDSWVSLYGRLTRYPFQTNTFGHDPRMVRECVREFLRAATGPRPRPGASYREWILRTFGRGFARHFMFPFNEKQFRTPLARLVPAQGGRFLPKPAAEDVVAGALGLEPGRTGYNAVLWRPRRGGIEALPRAMAARLRRAPETGAAVRKVLWRRRKALVDGAGLVQYGTMVSTMPLPDLLGMLEPAVPAMEKARRALKWIGVVCISYLVRRPQERRRHWIYIPERRYTPFRVGFPGNINPPDVPAGRGIVSAEVSYLPGARPSLDSMVARAARDLRALGVLGPVRDLEGVLAVDMPCAYVLFDGNHRAARRAALGFLARHGIIGIGRYGNWNYGGMEDAIREGREAARLVNAYGSRAGERFPAGRD